MPKVKLTERPNLVLQLQYCIIVCIPLFDMDQTSEAEKQYQKQIYEEITQSLISAGYFRARLRSLVYNLA